MDYIFLFLDIITLGAIILLLIAFIVWTKGNDDNFTGGT
jgi:hypothetical protein